MSEARKLFVQEELARLVKYTAAPDLALEARVKALQERANNRPEFVAERESDPYRIRLRGYSVGFERDD